MVLKWVSFIFAGFVILVSFSWTIVIALMFYGAFYGTIRDISDGKRGKSRGCTKSRKEQK